MQLKEFNILLDIKKHNKTDYFEVVQGDLNSNILNIALVDGLNPYNLAGTNVEIVFSKPDGTTVQQTDITIINATQGRIQCTLKTNTIASPGKVIAEVRVLEGEILLTSARFDFFVRKALITDDTIESTNEFPILNQLITTTEGLIQQVEQIEKQVPENVLDELNNLSALAGQLQSELSDLEADVNSHKAESVSQVEGVHGLQIEKGVFTPTLEGTSVAGNHTYSVRKGKYKKIGSTVICDINMTISTLDESIAGLTTITGLPFVPDMNYVYSGNVGRVSNLIWVASYKQLTAAIPNGHSKLYLYALQDGANFVGIGVNTIKDGFTISLKIVYEI